MCNHSTFHCYPCIRIPISPILWRVKRDSLNLLFLSIRMAYLSFYSPLLRELGQGSFRLTRSLPVWGSDIFFHGNLHDIWGRKVQHGFGDADVHETLTCIHITADLPGAKREDIHVGFMGDVLSISSRRQRSQYLTDDIYNNMERAFGSISKSIRLPPCVDIAKITAKYVDGVLTIDIPKPKESSLPEKEIVIPIE